LSVDELLVIIRVRWQIELLFKLWKSSGRIDESRSHKPFRKFIPKRECTLSTRRVDFK